MNKLLFSVFTFFLFSTVQGQFTLGSNTSVPICSGNSDTIFSLVTILDMSSSMAISVVNYTSSDPSVINSSDISISVFDIAGTYQLTITTSNCNAGSTTISFDVQDALSPTTFSTITMPMYTVNASPSAIAWDVSNFQLCSNENTLDLNQFVSAPGVIFKTNGVVIPEGILDPLNFGFIAGNDYSIYTYITNGVCSDSISAVFQYQEAVALTMSSTPSVCNSLTGTATVDFTTPNSSTINWSDGSVGLNTISNINAGIYEVNVMLSNGCLSTGTVVVGQSSITITEEISNVLCYGGNNGVISLTSSPPLSVFSAIWSNGVSGLSVSDLTAGTYSVDITDNSGCNFVGVYAVSEPAEIQIVTNTISPLPCGSATGSITVNTATGGTGTFNYQWSTGGLGNSIINLEADVYSLTTTDENGCQTINTVFLSDAGAPLLPGAVIRPDCAQNNGSIDVSPILNVGQTMASTEWNTFPISTAEDMININQGYYECKFVTNDGCTALNGWNIPVLDPMIQDICVVTVDSATTTNLLVWEPSQQVGITHYNIYRETTLPGEFLLIDTVNFTNQTVFNDVIASPKVRSWKYKIGAVNACNREATLGEAHRTIHLAISDQGGNPYIAWNDYEGIAHDFVDLWRFTNTNEWELIATLPSSQTSFPDLNALFTEPGLDYMLEFTLSSRCSPEKAQDFNAARSNREKGSHLAGQGTGDSNNSINDLKELGFQIYPNPFENELSVYSESFDGVHYQILNSNGTLILKGLLNKYDNTIPTETISSGLYLLEINTNEGIKTVKIIK